MSHDYRQNHPDEEFLYIQEPHWDGGLDYFWYNIDDKPVLSRKVGYIAVSETEFVEVYQNLLLLLLLFMGACLLGLLLMLKPWSDTEIPDAEKDPLKIDDSQTEWQGELPNVNDEVPEQENIEIPGFYKFIASAEAGSVPLYNPVSNTVYFQYDIYEILNTVEVGSFATASEAQIYVKENSTDYSIQKDDGYYLLSSDGKKVDTLKVYKSVPSGDKYTVVEEEVKAVYATDMVSPGNQVLWDATKFLSVGEHKLKFIISTYDIETGGECYGAVQTVEATIK